MIALGFVNDDIVPCLFIKQKGTEFIIIAIYVDDINLVGTKILLEHTITTLKTIFEMKDIGKPLFCLGIQFEHLPNGILIHQSTYTRKLLKQFNIDKSYRVTTPMELRSSNTSKDMYKQRTEQEPILEPE